MSRTRLFIFSIAIPALLTTAIIALQPHPTHAQADTDATAGQDELRLNELMSDNKSTIVDPQEPGETPDWIELYNPSGADVSLNGLGIADSLPLDTGHVFTPGITIPARGFLILYADSDPKQGPTHLNFKLSSAGGESLYLFRVSTGEVIDTVASTPPLGENISYGRRPDGSGQWIVLPVASPGAPNSIDPPYISEVTKFTKVDYPINGAVTINAVVTDTQTVMSVTLHYSTTAGVQTSVPMNPVGNDVFAAAIPAQPARTLVVFYVEAVDNDNDSARWPIPGRERQYFTGYTPPLDLVINEITVQNDDQHVDPDEPLETPDWIELYNKGATRIRLDGLTLTDDNNLTRLFEIPAGLAIGPGQRMMFLADDDVGQNPPTGARPPIHLPFNLNRSNAYVGLYGGMGAVQIDDKDIKDPPPYGAVGRYPDGGEWSNKLIPPQPVCQTYNLPNLLCAHTVDLPKVQK